jgi:hypothetical protein
MSSIRRTRPVRVALAGVGLLAAQLLVGGRHVDAAPPQTAPAAQAPPPAQPAPAMTLEQKEAFLLKAKIIRTRAAGKGVTGTTRATLSDGTIVHDASIQTIDEFQREFKTNRGTELNFHDTWRYNVAAYRLDRLLELDMIPPSVERNYQSKPGAFTWWVDDVVMDEAERMKTKTTSPDIDHWNQQMWHVRLFDQLIYNTDRNLGNLLIDKNWTIWMIDHSRAFRLFDRIKTPNNLSKVDRAIYDRLKALDEPKLKAVMSGYLNPAEIRALLKRRGEIVAVIDKKGAQGVFERTR